MRLLQTLSGAPQGGAETFFVSLASAFERARLAGTIDLTQRAVIRHNPERTAALRTAGVDTRELGFGGRLDLATRRGLKREVADFRPNVVLAYMNRAASWMPDGDFLKCARLGGYYDIKYYRRCDHLLCITAHIRQHMIQQGWPADRAHVLENFATVDDLPAAERSTHDTPADAPLLLVPSRLHVNKGLDVMLRALKREPRAYLWLAGSGPEQERLQDLARDLGVEDRVRFLGWRSDRGALFRAADIVVFPSRHEPFGTVSLEAWAYRRPLVAADASGPAGLVRNGEDALLVPREDDLALAEAITRVIDTPGFAGQLVEQGHARYLHDYTEAACVRRYMEMLGRLSGTDPQGQHAAHQSAIG
ncbi:glycosyltransferase [Rhodovibrio salinarum]|uniref:Glycosyltransferase n=1 Tax=Rhodovibrio salinarum TaxID=1087 RepID=A0A934QKL1_9PROT|nr:glycosyltransferase [Rhodovibrio salinarum]MBK1698581.1 glycosyltransferase [Rhodovibrio salinarum]